MIRDVRYENAETKHVLHEHPIDLYLYHKIKKVSHHLTDLKIEWRPQGDLNPAVPLGKRDVLHFCLKTKKEVNEKSMTPFKKWRPRTPAAGVKGRLRAYPT